MPQELTLPEKVVEYIDVSATALEKAAEDQQTAEEQRKKIASLIPAAVDALVTGEQITEQQREKAAQILADPVQTIELLTKVAVHHLATQRQLGSPVDAQTKQAGANGHAYNSVDDPRVGLRTSMEKQSDVNFKKRLGLG